MNNFDPYTALLQNFSKHKFKLFIEEFILQPKRHAIPGAALWGKVDKESWEREDYAQMYFPVMNLHEPKIVGGINWVFHLHHVEDGLIQPNMMREYVKKRNLEVARKIASDTEYFVRLQNFLQNRTWLPSSDSAVTIYFLTNMNIKTRGRAWSEYLSRADAEISSVFVKKAEELGFESYSYQFSMGVGNPHSFVKSDRELAANLIKEIEDRPDSINLQFIEGRIKVICANRRQLSVYDNSTPKIILLDQIIDPSNYFLEQEIEEFEALLNDTHVREHELQKFLEAHPKFILGKDYDDFRPQVSLVDEQSQELIPDFFIKPIQRKLWDILELKLPHVSLVSGSKNREGLSVHVRRGVSQLMNYSRFFDNPRNRDRVYRATGIDIFKPKLTLAIGKKLNIDEELWNRIIDQERPFVNILGFDEVLERAKKGLIRRVDL